MKRLLCVLVCAVLLVIQNGCLPAEIQNTTRSTSRVQQITQRTTATTQPDEIFVYITNTGAKYHKYYCGYLWNSCIEISLQDAIDSGYTDCKRCQPPIL